jgi:hypothetical protein
MDQRVQGLFTLRHWWNQRGGGAESVEEAQGVRHVNWNIVGLAAVLVAALACIKDDRGGHVVCRNHDTVVFDGPVKDVFLWSVDGSTVARIEKPDGSRVNIEGDAGKVAAIETWKLHVKLLPTPQPCCWCGTTGDVALGLDPGPWECHSDNTLVWMCSKCRDQSAEDV